MIENEIYCYINDFFITISMVTNIALQETIDIAINLILNHNPNSNTRCIWMYLAFRQEEAEKNRQHELRIAEMCAKICSRETQPNVLPNPINLPPSVSNPRNILHTNSQPYSYEHTMLNREVQFDDHKPIAHFPLSLDKDIQTRDRTNKKRTREICKILSKSYSSWLFNSEATTEVFWKKRCS